MNSKSLKFKDVLIVLALALGAWGAVVTLVTPSPEQVQIEARAKSLFELDAKKIKRLPAGELRSLSVALGFKNYQGAAVILKRLERL